MSSTAFLFFPVFSHKKALTNLPLCAILALTVLFKVIQFSRLNIYHI